MKQNSTLLLILIVFFAWTTQGQMSTELAPLHKHLLAVNAQWKSLEASNEMVSFASSDDRIQRHLFEAHALLSSNTPEDLTTDQQHERSQLLRSLKAYAEHRSFPRNTRHNFQIPYFVDDFGTPCAVAHLMQEAGNSELVASVNENFNYSYIAEMPQQPIEEWAFDHGFEVWELKLIQPAYPSYPTSRWLPFSFQVNGPVNKVEYDAQLSRVCFAGSFDTQGVKNFGCQDEFGNVISFSNSLEGEVLDFGYHWDDHYILAGDFTPGQGCAVVDQSGLEYIDQLTNAAIYTSHAIEVSSGRVFFDAFFPTLGTSSVCELIKDDANQQWMVETLFEVDGSVNDLFYSDGILVVGGEFMSATSIDDTIACNNIIWHDSASGQFFDMDGGFDGYVNRIINMDGLLVVCGDCRIDSTDTGSCIMSYEFDWMPLIDRDSFELNFIGELTEIFDAYSYYDTLLIAGNFYDYDGGRGLAELVEGGNVRKFGYFNHPVRSITENHYGKLLVAGEFDSYNHQYYDGAPWPWYATLPVEYMAVKTDSLTSVNDPVQSQNALQVYPNPVTDQLIIELESQLKEFRLFDIHGRQMEAVVSANAGRQTLDVSGLRSGTYILEVVDGENSTYRREFVVNAP